MIAIDPIDFPLNLGTADTIKYSVMNRVGIEGGTLVYMFMNSNSPLGTRLAKGEIELTQEQYTQHFKDTEWLEDLILTETGASRA